MPDLSPLADLGRLSVGALWVPVAAWTVVALVTEAGLRLSRASAGVGLPVRGAVLAALPLAVAVSPVLGAFAPRTAAAVATLSPAPRVWLPEVVVGGAEPATEAATAPAVGDVVLGLAVLGVGFVAVVGLLRFARGVWAAAETRRALAPAASAVQDAVDSACIRLGVPRPVAAAVAPPRSAPFTVGWRRPVVAVPPDLGGEALEVAVVHEVAHVRQADYVWHAAQAAVTALFAAHPLVWALGRGLDLDRERAADAVVLAACPGRQRTYADLLFSYAALPAPALALGAARGSSVLKSRIAAMTRPLSPPRLRRALFAGRALGALLLALATGGALLAAAPPVPLTDALRVVEGVVTDADTGEPLGGASLQVMGTSVGAATGPDGRYRLDAPAGDQAVRVSLASYETRTVALGANQTALDVALTTANVGTRPVVNRSQAPAPDVYEVAEVQPQLIGGLAGLQERVVYPPLARNAGIEGRVVLQFVVDEEGLVTDPVVLRAPHEMLAEAALAAVRESRFEPGRQRGEPVKVRFAVPITFRLPAAEGQGERMDRPPAPPPPPRPAPAPMPAPAPTPLPSPPPPAPPAPDAPAAPRAAPAPPFAGISSVSQVDVRQTNRGTVVTVVLHGDASARDRDRVVAEAARAVVPAGTERVVIRQTGRADVVVDRGR